MIDIYFWSKNGLSIEELKKDPNLEFTIIADERGGEQRFISLKGKNSGGFYRDDEELWYLSGAFPFNLAFYLCEKYDVMFVADANEDAFLCYMVSELEDDDRRILVEYTCRNTMYQILKQTGNLTDEFEALYRKSKEEYSEMRVREDDAFERYFKDKEQDSKPKTKKSTRSPITGDELPF